MSNKWTVDNVKDALKEGWLIGANLLLASMDSAFLGGSKDYAQADERVYQFVKAKAEKGSKLHQKALVVLIENKLRK